jgi:hypothetical protein
LNDRISSLKTPSDAIDEYKSLRGPGLAPTTEMGKHHDTIDRSINHRESLEIGKSLLSSRSIAKIGERQNERTGSMDTFLPRMLNDLNRHKDVRSKNYNFNVITGSYMQKSPLKI